MNTDTIKGNWMIFKGKVKEQWGKLTDDDLDVAEGQAEQLAGRIAARYGEAKEAVQKKIDALRKDCDCS